MTNPAPQCSTCHVTLSTTSELKRHEKWHADLVAALEAAGGPRKPPKEEKPRPIPPMDW